MAIVISTLMFALLGLVAMEVWVLLHLRTQGASIQKRIDAIGRRVAAEAPVAPNRGFAPSFDLPDLDGRRHSLSRLLAARKPLLLVFSDSRCAPCYELMPDVGGWERQYREKLSIAVVSGGHVEHNRAMTAEYGISVVLLQEEREVADVYDVQMAPAAVVIGPDGRLMSDIVYGAPQVRKLVAQTLGLALPDPPGLVEMQVEVGEVVPPTRLPDLDGNVITFPAIGRSTFLLFWSPGCHHCAEIVPEINRWESLRDDVTFIIVSSGPAAAIQSAGLNSPIVQDTSRKLNAMFGVSGTPAALVIDERGVVVSSVAQGAGAVRALAARLLRPEPIEPHESA